MGSNTQIIYIYTSIAESKKKIFSTFNMSKLTAVLMFLLFANVSARKISSISEQQVEDRNAASALESATKWADAVQKMVDPIKGQLDNVDKAIDIATKARTFIQGMKTDQAIIINLSEKEGTWYTYNDAALVKYWTQFQSYMGAYTTITVHTLGFGSMHCYLNNKNPPFTVQRNAVYEFDGKNLSLWFHKE